MWSYDTFTLTHAGGHMVRWQVLCWQSKFCCKVVDTRMQGDTLTVTKPQVCYVYTDTAGGHRDTYGMLAGFVLAKQILL